MLTPRHLTIAASLFAAGTSALAQVPQIRLLPPVTPAIVTYHGAAVAALPDVNGDGVPDIAVSSLYAIGNIGRVYIYSGATGQIIRQLVSPNPEADSFYGQSISAVPDLNGDGVADIVVGAPMDSPGTSPQATGRVYIYSGATGQFILRLIPPSQQYFCLLYTSDAADE